MKTKSIPKDLSKLYRVETQQARETRELQERYEAAKLLVGELQAMSLKACQERDRLKLEVLQLASVLASAPHDLTCPVTTAPPFHHACDCFKSSWPKERLSELLKPTINVLRWLDNSLAGAAQSPSRFAVTSEIARLETLLK